MKIVYIPLAGYLTFQAAMQGDGWWFVGLFVAVALVIVDTIPDLLIRPYVSGGGSLSLRHFISDGRSEIDEETADRRATPGLHTGTLMFAYVLGPFLFGWYGIFLAPMILVLVVHFARFVLPEIVSGKAIRPYAVDPTNLVQTAADPTGESVADESQNDAAGTAAND
jgi:predicted PurR-regulated permease PerM